MALTATQAGHEARIRRVLDHVQAHLDHPLDLARVAEVGAFSPFHFHRIWRAAMGETPADTVRRLRLHRAAVELATGDAPIARIIRRAGYGSAAAFGRAFADAHGIPPAAFRARHRAPDRPDLPQPRSSYMPVPVTIVDVQSRRLLGIRHVGPYPEIGGAFDTLGVWAGTRGLLGPGTQWIGIYPDDPQAVPPRQQRADACITAPADATVEAPVAEVRLEGGRHAVYRHIGPYAELESAYLRVIRDWLPGSGEDLADRPCFEVYVNDAKTVRPAELITDIHLPLR